MIDGRYNYSKYLDSVIDGFNGDYITWQECQKYSNEANVDVKLAEYFNTLRIALIKYDILLPESILNNCSRDLQRMKSLIVDCIMCEPLDFLNCVVLRDFINDKQVIHYFLTNVHIGYNFERGVRFHEFSDWFTTNRFNKFCVGLWLDKILNEHINSSNHLDLDLDSYNLLVECNLGLRSLLTDIIEPVYNHTEIDNVSKTLFDINLKEEN